MTDLELKRFVSALVLATTAFTLPWVSMEDDACLLSANDELD